MKSYLTFSRWFLGLAFGFFLFGSSLNLIADNFVGDEIPVEVTTLETAEPEFLGFVSDDGNDQELSQRRVLRQNAQTGQIPALKQNAKSSTTFTIPSSGSRATTDIKIELTVDNYPGEASYNLWSWDDMAYYWPVDQTFAASFETIVHVLALEEGSEYDLDCFDSWGDGGIAGVVTNDGTGWPIIDWSAGDYGSYGAFNFVAGPGTSPPVLQPIATFPFEEDFESGSFPNTGDVYVLPVTDVQSDAYVSNVAGNGSGFGAVLEGGASGTGWTGGSSSATYENAFTDNVTHIAELSMIIEPEVGNPGYLFLSFDMRQNYSFGWPYEWLRVLVDGVPVANINGDTYWNPSTPQSDPWQNLTFDLTEFKDLASFEITIQNSGKYYLNYFDGGDVAMIDNLQVLYSVPGLEIVNGNLDMGDRPIGAWMKPAAYQLINNPGAGDITITEADIDENFGGFLAVESPALPFTLPSGETTYEFGVNTTEAPVSDGAFSGSFAMFFDSRAVVTADYSGNAYTPVAGDVWEMAFDANAVTFPDNVAMGSFVDNYDLPGTTDDGWDVVYMIDVDAGAGDVVVDVSLTGTDAKMALYPSDFDGVGGPDMDNALYEATTTATGLELFEGVYYLVVSTTGADFTLDIVEAAMPAPDQVTYTYPLDQAVDISNTDSLTWVFGANTLEYELVLGTTYPPATVVVPYTSDLATTYQLDNLNPNLQYFWQVNVRNNNGETAGEIWGFTTTIDPPADLTVTVNDGGEEAPTVSAELEWTSPLDRALIGYNIYRDAVMINTDPVVGTSFTDLGLARNTTYAYYVTAVFDEGESPASNTESVTTQGVGTADGVIYDFLTNDPIEGATVRVQGTEGDYVITTGADGAYSTLAYAGTYSITVTASGYTQSSMNGVFVTHDVVTTNDFFMMETPLPVGDVTAFELSEDAVQISWDGSGPEPIAEWLGYDDGTNTNNFGSTGVHTIAWAVKFTPEQLATFADCAVTKVMAFGDAGYAATALELKVWQGDNRETLLYTYDVLAEMNFDGTWTEIMLPAAVEFDDTEALWIGFEGAANGLNYLAAAGPRLDVGEENADHLNYNGSGWNTLTGYGFLNMAWNLETFVTNAYGATMALNPRTNYDMMKSFGNQPMEMVVNENPAATARKHFNPSTRGIVDYTVWREKVYQPEALVEVGNTTQQNFVDFDWETMVWGVYRWAVTVNYEAGQTSAPTYSNTLDKNMLTMVDVAVTLNSGEAPGGTTVTFTNTSEPALELVYETTLDNSGLFAWDEFRRGVYDIEVAKLGYGTITETGVEIFDESSFEWLLEEILAAPAGLYVTPTAFATWEGGTGDGFEEYFADFEANDGGWVASELFAWGTPSQPIIDVAFSGSKVWMTDLNADYPNSTEATLMKEFDFSAAANPYFSAQLFIETENNYDGMVLETSIDGGATWQYQDIASMYNSTAVSWGSFPGQAKWSGRGTDYIMVEGVLNDVAGESSVWLRFRFKSDSSVDGNGIAIDDVLVGDMTRSAASVKSFDTFKVFLDGQLVAETADSEYQYDVAMLTPYETYTAGVAAVYTTGQSDTEEFDFIYVPCGDYDAPTAFAAAQVEGTLDIMLEWTNVDAAALDTISALRIYRNGEEYAELDFTDEAVAMFLDEDLDFGMYTYCVTYIYDSGAETCQGVTCSDEIEIDGNAGVDGMVMQAAYLGGDPIEGASVMLVNVDDPDVMFEFFTDATGAYEGMVIAGTYDYTVSAMGYTSVMLEGVEIVLNATVTNDFELVEFPYPPILVVAEEITDNNVLVTWNNPFYAPFEPVFTDFNSGIPADWTVVAGGTTADTWEGVANLGGNSLNGTPMALVDSDGAGIGPILDEMLYTPIVNAATAEELYLTFDQYYRHLGTGSYGAVEVYDGTDWVTVLNQTATAGAWNAPNQQMIDVTAYANEEFQVRFHYFDNGSWAWYWALDNVAITDAVTRSGEPVLSNTEAPERGLFGYEVWRTTCETGDLEFLGLTLDTLFNDNTWGSTEAGIYKWGVRAVYDEENYSEVVFSNCLDKDMITAVSVTVTTNSTDGPEETDVMFTNTSEPDLELVYETELDETGYFMWEEFRKGIYDIYVNKNGFAPIEITDYLIDGPEDFVWILEELLLPVSDLYVTPTGFATWSQGGVIPFEPYAADFETDEMGWEIQGNVNGWQWGNNASLSSAFMNFDGNTTNFIAVNADAAGSGGTPIVALTKSPMLDLSGAGDAYVSFDYRLRTDAMSVHYSIGGGDPILLEDLATNTTWTNDYMVMLPEEALTSDVQILFLFEEGSTWGYGGGVDNVVVTDEPMGRALEYYKVWLDGVFVTDTPDTFWQYDIADLVEGQEYLAEVAAVYSNGISAKMSYVWTYYSCENYPGPENLAGSVSGMDVTLTWGSAPPPPPPGEGFVDDFEGHADFVIDFAPWTNVDVDGSDTYGMTGIDWPNIYLAQSFIVFNPSTTTPPVTDMTAHSGDKFVACFASVTAPNNDWLISPSIPVESGATVNFWAKSYVADYGLERFKVGVSTTGVDPADFTIITPGDYVEAPVDAWTEFSYDLSAYAGQDVYIGIQCVSNDAFIFMLDDFTVGTATTSFAFNPSSTEIGRGTREIGEAAPAIDRHNHSEMDANAEARTVGMSREMWDLEFSFDIDTPSGLVGLAGAETDGEYIYATKWSSSSDIVKFTMDGTYVETFQIPGVSSVRDMAFDGTYMYGAAASTTVFQMDFTNKTLIGTITAPTAVRAIAYDDVNDAFWGNNFATDMVLFDRSGATLNTIVAPPSMYGAAFDNFSEGGPYLWFFTGTSTGAGCQLEQYDIAGGALTGVSHSVSAELGDYIAGGLYISEDLVEDKVVIGGTAQGTPDLAFAFELIDNSGGGGGGGGGDFETGPVAGVNVYRDGMLIAEMVQDTFYVDPDVDYGMYTYCVTYVYESGAESCSEACVDVEIAFPCDAPKELAGEYLWTEEAWGAMIEWNSPQDAIAEWLFYDDGVNVDGIGGPATFTWAIKFDPAQLADYDGASLTKIEIYNRVAGSNELRIYEGTNAATLLHTQTLSGLGIETWEEVDLTDAVMLDVTKELWIGVYTTNGAAFPAGCGGYTGNPNSDLITLDGVLWEHLNDLGLPYTWNLRGYVTTMAGATAALPMDKPVDSYSNTGESVAASGKPSYQTAGPASSTATADRELDVFNVYRSLGDDNYELISTVPFEEGVTAYSYFDTDVEAQVGYNYQVTAFYTYTNGTCESDPAMALVNPDDDFVYIFVTNTNEFNLNNTRVYPNPANNNVVIESAQMNRITVMSALGQVVIDRAIEGQMRYDLNTSTYEAGIYLIRIETNEGAVTKRLTIVR